MDSIGGVLKHIGKMPKTQEKMNFVMVLLETIMVYIGMWWIILMVLLEKVNGS